MYDPIVRPECPPTQSHSHRFTQISAAPTLVRRKAPAGWRCPATTTMAHGCCSSPPRQQQRWPGDAVLSASTSHRCCSCRRSHDINGPPMRCQCGSGWRLFRVAVCARMADLGESRWAGMFCRLRACPAGFAASCQCGWSQGEGLPRRFRYGPEWGRGRVRDLRVSCASRDCAA
jgi:hypothetical protein